MPDLKQWQKKVHQVARDHGWYDGELGEMTELRLTSMLCLIHSEVSEALEALREGKMTTTQERANGYKPQGFPSELADIIIRVLDTAEWLGLDMENEVMMKNAYNEKREYRHGGKKL